MRRAENIIEEIFKNHSLDRLVFETPLNSTDLQGFQTLHIVKKLLECQILTIAKNDELTSFADMSEITNYQGFQPLELIDFHCAGDL